MEDKISRGGSFSLRQICKNETLQFHCNCHVKQIVLITYYLLMRIYGEIELVSGSLRTVIRSIILYYIIDVPLSYSDVSNVMYRL